jgi:hypothetical protein
MNTNEPPKKLDISKPSIKLVQSRVFRNGLQQAEIRIDLESTHDGVPSNLTPTEIASIRLFDYHNRESGHIPFSDGGSTYEGWSAQRDFRGYISQPSSAPEPQARQSYSVYLSANANALETLDVAFEIKGDDGSIFWTNGRKFVNGTEQAWSGGDLSVDITVTPLSPEKYPSTSFVLDRRPLDGRPPDIGQVAPGIFTDIVTVSIVLAGSTTLGIREMDCVPEGLIHWKGPRPSANPCFTGYVRPWETAIRWHPDIKKHWGLVPPPTHLDTPPMDHGVIVLAGRLDIPSWTGAPKNPVEVLITDAHGSKQRCHIGFKEGTRDELVVT